MLSKIRKLCHDLKIAYGVKGSILPCFSWFVQQNNKTRHFDDVTKAGQLSAKHVPEKKKES